MEKIFFQASLPRAGSTLLQNVMGQNPDFYVTPTSGVLELIYAARGNFDTSPEFKAQDGATMDAGWKSFAKAGLEGFFDGITDKKYAIDKSRGWAYHYPQLNAFYPDPKIICMVRDPRSIFSSMEKNHRKNEGINADIVDHTKMAGITTQQRVQSWAAHPPVGMALQRLQQIIHQGTADKMLFIKFEEFAADPGPQLDRIYNFLEVPIFQHDFNNVEQITVEDDAVYGPYGDHKIKKEIRPVKEDWNNILGIQTSQEIRNGYNWFYEYFQYK